jgi:hypothetical protein
MITNKGIELMCKYLAGQVPAFVSHIAIGCGANPLIPSETHDTATYATKTALDFEMERIPVKSRSVVNIDGVNQMIFSAELPQTNRYGITEIGIYPAEKSNAAGSVDSSIISSFSPTEEWLTNISGAEEDIALVTSRLDVDQTDNTVILDSIDTANLEQAFFIDSNNSVFSVDARVERNEQPRYLSNALMVRGDLSGLTIDSETRSLTIDTNNFIKITGISLTQLDQASQAFDKIKLAFSLINKQNSTEVTAPSNLKMVVRFTNTTTSSSSSEAYAEMIIDRTSGFGDGYVVEEVALKDLWITGDFSWNAVAAINIYVDVSVSGVPSPNYFIALDALKFENLSNTDARYGLAGYTIAKNASTGDASKGIPIIKHEDTSSYIEFRFSLDRI